MKRPGSQPITKRYLLYRTAQDRIKIRIYAVSPLEDYGPGRSTIYGRRAGSGVAANGGTAWGLNEVDAAIKGYSLNGNNYTAGVAGYNFMHHAESAGVIGAIKTASIGGILGYNDAAEKLWAGYFKGDGYFSGDVGIGTTTPTAKLNVVGDANISGSLSAGAGFTVLFVDDVTDRVGIGTTSPTEKLHVEGDTRVTGNLIAEGISTGKVKQLIEHFRVAAGEDVNARDVVSFVEGSVQKGFDQDISYGSEYVFSPNETQAISVAALSATKFVVAYRDWDNSNYGTAIIGEVAWDKVIVIAKESGIEFQPISVVIGGVAEVSLALTLGAVYYSNASGELTISEGDLRVGLTISPGQLL